jgi:predicted nucleic acid-binding protein
LSESGAGEAPQILVVDTGVAAKWYLNEELEEEATRVLDAGSKGSARLVAPDSIAAEFFNVLWQHHMGRRGKAHALSVEDVESYWREFSGAPLELFRAAPLMHRAVEITFEIGVIVYDSLFLALAEVGSGILVTADERTILNRIKGTPYEPLAIHLSNVDTLAAIAPAKSGDGDIAE